ncbi:MAG: hypothetical protein IJ658_08200 [Kiritimatiellae bacterium]|nr:hypothetical protein [Kiritimatiellia bacterium]
MQVKRAFIHVIALAALAAAVVGGVLLWRQRPWRVSVSVNGRVITARELDMRAQLLLEDGRRTGRPPSSVEDCRRQAAARWIVKELLLSESVARGVELGAEDEREELGKLEEDLKAHHLTVEQYFRQMPLPEELMRRDFREVLLLKKFLKKEVDDKVTTTTADIESCMNALKSKAFLRKVHGDKGGQKTDRKSVTDMLRASLLNKGYRDLLRSLCEKADIRVPDYPEFEDAERYVMPWCPKSRHRPLPEGIMPEEEKK